MLLIKAVQFAGEKHKGQYRRESGLPYVIHPITVAFLLAENKESKKLEELMVAALLHDTLEDTDATFEEIAREFTPMVASLVLELTSDPEEIEEIGKNEYLTKKMVGMSSYALVIKLADRLSNIMDRALPTRIERIRRICSIRW
jgi:(p)ppGpp synthase/HD superfamily hydrolase